MAENRLFRRIVEDAAGGDASARKAVEAHAQPGGSLTDQAQEALKKLPPAQPKA